MRVFGVLPEPLVGDREVRSPSRAEPTVSIERKGELRMRNGIANWDH